MARWSALRWVAVLFLFLVFFFESIPAGAQGKTIPGRIAAERQASRAASRVLLTWGVGGVLTEDGTLWQYRPESRRWVTIDQSFALDGERRKVLPLPVAAREIARMEGFRFLVTQRGVAWLYNLDQNRWENVGTPGR